MLNGTTTVSPRLICVTSAPTSSTIPIGSWPSTSPRLHRHGRAVVEQVQVGAADPGRGHPDDRVGRLLDPRVIDVADGHRPRGHPPHRTHTAWLPSTDHRKRGTTGM